MTTFNSYASAARKVADLVDSGKGELAHGSTGVKRLDAFGSLKRTSDAEQIDEIITNMYREYQSILDPKYKTEALLDIFRLMIHKRAVTRSKNEGGEGERHLFYLYFLRIYDDFPDTLISMVKSDIIPYYGYWKDYRYIWKMICEKELSSEKRYTKYNGLICAMRDSILDQRSKDLVCLSNYVKPNKLSNMTTDEFKTFMTHNYKSVPSLNMCGKFCVREKGADNKNLYWYIRDSTSGKLLMQPHTSFMVRARLSKRNRSGEVIVYPNDKPVPFGALKSWRKCNAKLNTALGVVENYMSAGEFRNIDPSGVTSMNNSRYMKAFLNEKRKGAVNYDLEIQGNRHPDDPDRVTCRKNFRNNIKDISNINVANLFPHQISTPIISASSTAQIDMYEAMWKALVNIHSSKLTAARTSYAEELSKSGSSPDLIREALLGGNFIGCCDISGSMGSIKDKNSPLSIAIGLTAFASEVAAEPYRDLAITFSSNPYIYSFKNSEGSMNLSERIRLISKEMGCNTNYYLMHKAVANMCKNSGVNEKDLPIIVVFTDGAMDSFDVEAIPSKWDTTHDKIRKMYASMGFRRVPTIVVWNLCKNTCGYASSASNKGYIQLQGQSPSLFKYIMYGEGCGVVEEEVIVNGVVQKVKVANVDPYTVFRKAMDNHTFFEPLLKVLAASSERGLSEFNMSMINGV